MTREEALRNLGGVLQGYLLKDDINQIYNDHEEQIKAKDEKIERLKTKVYCLENDTIVLNMEQRLIDIALVLEGKLTSKEQQ